LQFLKNFLKFLNVNEFSGLGKFLILIGVVIVALGLLLTLLPKLPYLGKLPGDIYIKKGNFTFYFPLATCILLSILLTIILNLIFRR
jgi:hypothetical protein